MLAVDTNIVVRLLTGDDPKQTASAKAVFASGPIWIAKTVLLETDWVLRRLYGYDEVAVRSALDTLFGLNNVHVEDHSSVAAALELAKRGVEFADALHLCSRPDGARFISFDQSCVKRATRAGVPAVSGV